MFIIPHPRLSKKTLLTWYHCLHGCNGGKITSKEYLHVCGLGRKQRVVYDPADQTRLPLPLPLLFFTSLTICLMAPFTEVLQVQPNDF